MKLADVVKRENVGKRFYVKEKEVHCMLITLDEGYGKRENLVLLCSKYPIEEGDLADNANVLDMFSLEEALTLDFEPCNYELLSINDILKIENEGKYYKAVADDTMYTVVRYIKDNDALDLAYTDENGTEVVISYKYLLSDILSMKFVEVF